MGWLHPDDYLEQAQQLPVNHDKRIGHWCGEGDVLKIAHKPQGYSAYCFRCGDTGFTPIERQTLSDFELLKQQEVADEVASRMELPHDFTQQIPVKDALWLFRAGISMDRAIDSGFGYSPSMSRVILPVYRDNRLVYLQARATRFPEQQPKYLNIAGADKGNILYEVKPTDILDGFERTVVLTEDILSANRVGEICPSASILGTKLSDGQALQIAAYDNAIWWLDGDDAGIVGARKGSTKLQFLVKQQRIIRTPKDPKLYSKRYIRSILRDRTYDIAVG